jgi:transcriptional regulator with XRE-family HTH domain
MGQRHRRSAIERLLRRRERDGLTYRELSEGSGIPIPTLAWWSRKLEREAEAEVQSATCELVAVEVVDDEVDEGGAAIEIVVGERLRLVVPATASEAHLQRVLRAVASC